MAVEREQISDTYPLVSPFSYALIQTSPVSGQVEYQVVESPLTKQEEEILKMIIDVITETLEFDFTQIENRKAASDYLRGKILDIIRNYNIPIEESSFDKIVYHINKDFIGFGVIDPLLADPNIEDISCDGTNVPVYVVHRLYQSIPTNIIFSTDEDVNSFVIKVAQRAGRHISVADPLLDASLPDGSRINCTYGREITKRGPTFTIRKFKEDPLTIVDLITYNTIDEKIAAFFWFVLEHGKSLLIAGGTAAGKTTLLNGVAMFIKPGNKIVSIEDTPELNIPHENWIQSVTRSGFGGFEASGRKRGEITMYDLLRAAVRQRPDFLFVGEVRGAEAFTLFQAMATGHSGMGTI
ncbi:MAG: type II/IV secretion system ATPase subunit, partial [Candidatus Hodarchaeales archaeon]